MNFVTMPGIVVGTHVSVQESHEYKKAPSQPFPAMKARACMPLRPLTTQTEGVWYVKRSASGDIFYIFYNIFLHSNQIRS